MIFVTEIFVKWKKSNTDEKETNKHLIFPQWHMHGVLVSTQQLYSQQEQLQYPQQPTDYSKKPFLGLCFSQPRFDSVMTLKMKKPFASFVSTSCVCLQ